LFLNPNRTTLVLLAVVVLVAFARADGQREDAPQTAQTTQSADDAQQTNGAPEQETDNQVPPYRSNPPIVGLHYPYPPLTGGENRSYLLPGAQFFGGVDGFEPDGFGRSNYFGTVRGLGSLTLQKLWRRYDLDLDYLGGAAYLGYRPLNYALLQSLDAEQHISWRTGQFAIRDSFSYLPEGNYGTGAYGAVGALSSLASGEGGLLGLGIFGPSQLAALGEQPRILNVTLADVTQYFSQKSSVFLAASYGFVHFTGGNLQLVNSQQVVTEAAYNHQFSRKNQIAVLYGRQEFHFPSLSTPTATLLSGSRGVETNLVNVLFGCRISERMEFIGGAGPQFTDIHNPLLGSAKRSSISGRASLQYRLRTTELFASFARYNTNGAGIFGGATTNVARFAANRPFGRVWLAGLELGYTQEHSLINFFVNQSEAFQYAYVGGGLHRQLGRELSAFVTYQSGYARFNSTFCVASSCGRVTVREVALVGLDWHPHPIRLE